MRRLLMCTAATCAFSLCLAMLAGVAPSTGPPAAAAQERRAGRPNVVLITADDMRADDLRYMPFTRGEFRRRGVTFSDALSAYPLCCPARAQIVTGQYNHNNGVQGNAWPRGGYWALKQPRNTLPVWLRSRGYLTGYVGKYMNEYEKNPALLPDPTGRLRGRRKNEVPPGWTHWAASVGYIYNYARVRMLVDTPTTRPRRTMIERYQTDYFSDVTTSMIRKYHKAGRPFFIWASHLAPHAASQQSRWTPPRAAPGDRRLYRRVGLPRSAAFRQAFNTEGVRADGSLSGRRPVPRRLVLNLHRGRLRSLRSLDRAVRATVAELKRTHEYADTTIIFTSDNGFMLGELRRAGKDLPYDPALRVPMIVNSRGLKVRYRPQARAAQRVTVPHTVTITDIASTIVGLTGVRPGRPLEGIDMTRPRQNPDVRPGGDRAVLIESGARGPATRKVHRFVGVRTNRWTWFTWRLRDTENGVEPGRVEHYDRRSEPAQVTSLAPDAQRGTRLRELTLDMYDCRGRECVRSLS
jgi:N-acetylglucosamine-6-sulfatase